MVWPKQLRLLRLLPPRHAPFSWQGPYLDGHIGYVTGTQNDNQSEVIPDPVCAEGEVLVDGVCVPDTITCEPGFILVDGICVIDDGGGQFCGTNEIFDPVLGQCVCAPGYFRDPVRFQCVRFIPGDKFRLNGLLGGMHAGSNWQRGSIVYGVEADLDYTTLQGGTDFAYPGGVTGRLSFRSDWQGSLRLRAGFAKDTWLFYGTGGLAFGHATLTAASAGLSMADNGLHVGWTVGAGIEKAFNQNWIGRVEARYTDFGEKGYDLGSLGNGVQSGWSQTSLTFGLSYKF